MGDTKGQQILVKVLLVSVVFAAMTAAFLGLKKVTTRIRLNEMGQRIADPKPNKFKYVPPKPKQ